MEPPFKRPRIFALAAATSLILFVLTAALWVRSRFASDYAISYSTDTAAQRTRGLMIYADDGRIAFVSRLYEHPDRPFSDAPWHLESRPQIGAYNDVRFYRFSHQRGTPGGMPTRTDLVLRLWPVVLLTSVLPALWLVGYFRRDRALGVRCVCGYQPHGIISGVCPECGAACKAADPAGVSPAAGN